MLPVECINRSCWMGPENPAGALVELGEGGTTPSRADRVLHHAPKALDRIAVMATRGREEVEPSCAVVMVQRWGEFSRPMATPALNDHHDLLTGFANNGPDLREILAQVERINMGPDLRHDT